MKRILLCVCVFAHTSVPIAEAQSPAVCEGVYRGSYNGAFSGSVFGSFRLGATFCDNPPPQPFIGPARVDFEGALAQFFFEDPTRRSPVSVGVCVNDQGAVQGVFGAFTLDGSLRQLFVTGVMDLNTCTISGTWTLQLTRFPPEAPPTIEEEGSGGFTMSLEPQAREGVIWTATNGDFNNPNNWQQQSVPTSGQDAVFNQNLAYAVSFGTPASSGGFIVEQGFVTFLTGAYQATGGSELAPSALVGTSAGNNTFLTLSSHHLTTAFSTFAPGAGHRGGVDVEDGSLWTEQARMVIGGAGSGSLDIADTGAVTALETQLGSEASGDGAIELTSDDARWTTGNIAVGLRGDGTVNLRAGSVQSHDVSIAFEPGSLGTVTVGSSGNTAIWEFDGDLEVGRGGIGRLNIVEGGHVVSTTTEINFVFVGLTAGSSIGNLRVEGASSTLDVPKAIVSAGDSSTGSGSGFINVKNGGLIKCRTAFIEQNGSLRIESAKFSSNLRTQVENLGSVALNNGTIVSADLRVLSGGAISGSGSILAATTTIEGSVAPSVVISTPKGLPEQDDAIGTLTFGGNVDFASATLEIDVAGLAEGNFDVIHATGAVDIQDSTVLFRFIDGFLPRTGDTVPFLVADGGVTIANLAMEFEGVAEGFQFEVREESGMLVFEALNDAQPIPIPSADLNKDGSIDFLDLLNFIEQMNQ